jgi:DNA helicase-2/ATP-dependent DNA helicase PcrA
VDLTAERWQVRDTARKNLYTGKTYNSVENIKQFFSERGAVVPGGEPPTPRPPAAPSKSVPAASTAPAPAKAKKVGPGSVIEHAKYGRGTIVRLEGSGEDTKVTVSFPGYGLKKLVAKFAGIRV